MNASTHTWWRKRRLVYNAGLIVAGMSAMTLLAVVLEFSRCRAPDIQGAPLKLVWLALGYAAAMAFANLVFSLGPFIEAKLRPENVNRFRRWSFGLGFAISMALPLTLPIVYLSRC